MVETKLFIMAKSYLMELFTSIFDSEYQCESFNNWEKNHVIYDYDDFRIGNSIYI